MIVLAWLQNLGEKNIFSLLPIFFNSKFLMILSAIINRAPIISEFPSIKCLTWIFHLKATKMCQFGSTQYFSTWFALRVKWQLAAYTLHRCSPHFLFLLHFQPFSPVAAIPGRCQEWIEHPAAQKSIGYAVKTLHHRHPVFIPGKFFWLCRFPPKKTRLWILAAILRRCLHIWMLSDDRKERRLGKGGCRIIEDLTGICGRWGSCLAV